MEQPFKEIQEIIKEHYEDLKNQLEVEKLKNKNIIYYNNNDKIEHLEKLIKAYESLFPHFCS